MTAPPAHEHERTSRDVADARHLIAVADRNSRNAMSLVRNMPEHRVRSALAVIVLFASAENLEIP